MFPNSLCGSMNVLRSHGQGGRWHFLKELLCVPSLWIFITFDPLKFRIWKNPLKGLLIILIKSYKQKDFYGTSKMCNW